MDGSFARYCAAVCGQVRFRPDRAAILSELWDHLEDHAAALEETGLSREEAKARAVEAMGDPVEVGKALDALHAPVAGWLLLALTWCARVCGVVSLVLLVLYGRANIPDLFRPMGTVADWTAASSVRTEDRIYYPTSVFRGKDRTYSVAGVRLVEKEDFRAIYYLLRVEHKNPWLRDPALQYLTRAEDDVGNHYPSFLEKEQLPTHYADGTPVGSSAGNPYASSPFVTYYDLWVTYIDPAATEITLICDYYGPREFTLTIPLEGGGTA